MPHDFSKRISGNRKSNHLCINRYDSSLIQCAFWFVLVETSSRKRFWTHFGWTDPLLKELGWVFGRLSWVYVAQAVGGIDPSGKVSLN